MLTQVRTNKSASLPNVVVNALYNLLYGDGDYWLCADKCGDWIVCRADPLGKIPVPPTRYTVELRSCDDGFSAPVRTLRLSADLFQEKE